MESGSRKRSTRTLLVLLGFASAVFLIPVHLHHDAHHLIDHHEADARPVSDHGHDHETPSHEHHSPTDHELLAVRTHDDVAATAPSMALLIVLPDLGQATRVTRFILLDANGPPGRPESGPPPSRAPPLS